MTFMIIRWGRQMIRGYARSWTDRFSTVRSIDHLVETEYWCRCFDLPRTAQGKFVKSAIWRRWILGIKLSQKKPGVYPCTREFALRSRCLLFFATFNYSDALGRLNRLLVSLVKRNYEWRLRNSGITASLGRGRVTDQLQVLLHQFLLKCYRWSGDQNRFYIAHSDRHV